MKSIISFPVPLYSYSMSIPLTKFHQGPHTKPDKTDDKPHQSAQSCGQTITFVALHTFCLVFIFVAALSVPLYLYPKFFPLKKNVKSQHKNRTQLAQDQSNWHKHMCSQYTTPHHTHSIYQPCFHLHFPYHFTRTRTFSL